MPCEWYDPASYGSCAGNVAKATAGDAFQSIAQSFGHAADHAVNWLWSQMSAATAVRLGGPGFDLELGIIAAIAGSVAVGLFSLQIIQSVLRREPGGLGRAAKGLVVAFIGGGVAIAVVNLLLGATDSLCAGVVKLATGTNLTGLGKLILGPSAITATVYGSAALLLLSLACIFATVIVYVSLVVRKVLIVVTAVFAPLAFAGSLADITVSWTRRWIETTVALIASKLILILIFVAGYGILIEGAGQASSGVTQRVTQVISGVLVLFLAGFAPWVALKVVHFTGDHAYQLHSLGSSALGGATAPGRMAQKAAPFAQRFAAPAAGAAGATAGSAFGGVAPGSNGAFAMTGVNGTPGSPGGQGGSGKPGSAGPGASQGGSTGKSVTAAQAAGRGGVATSRAFASSPAGSQESQSGPGDGARSTVSATSASDTDGPLWPRKPPTPSVRSAP
jgi:type IV secretion system protein TrbL